MFTSIDKALVAAIMGILFIVQTYTGFSMAWATPDTIATIIGLVTPVLVWAIPNKKVALACTRRRALRSRFYSSASALGWFSWRSGPPSGSSAGQGWVRRCCRWRGATSRTECHRRKRLRGVRPRGGGKGMSG